MKKLKRTLGPVFKGLAAIFLEPFAVAVIVAILNGIIRML